MKNLRLIVSGGIIIFVLVGGIFWWKQATAAVDPLNISQEIFVVSKGEGIKTIARRLKEKGLIRDQIAFFLLIKKENVAKDIQAGDFRLSSSMDTLKIIQELTHGTLDLWITTIEGWRVEEIALSLAKNLNIPESEFLKVSREGYMFPDTYLIPKEATAAAIAKIFRDNFERRFDEGLRAEAATHGLRVDQVITLASIVEKEASGKEDRAIIAGILRKRWRYNWPLQADATVQYGLGYIPEQKSWWKKNLTEADKKIASPYNTYKFAGLPPGPIANPGLASIKAVINPREGDYWYYLHDEKGDVHYATTLEEHNENIVKYLK